MSHKNRQVRFGSQAIVANPCLCSVIQLCLTLCNPMDYGLPGSSVHGILQASQPLLYVNKRNFYFLNFISLFFFLYGVIYMASWGIKKAECQGIDAFEL